MDATDQQIEAINKIMSDRNNRIFNEALIQAQKDYEGNPHNKIKTWSDYYRIYKYTVDSEIKRRLRIN